MKEHYRVSKSPRDWFVAGWSTGGFCAALMMAKHPDKFYAGAVLAPYYTPVFEDFSILRGRTHLVTENSPRQLVAHGKVKSLRLLSIMSMQDPQSWGDRNRLFTIHGVVGV